MVDYLTDKDKETLLQKIKQDRIVMKNQRTSTQESLHQRENQFYELIQERPQKTVTQTSDSLPKTNYHRRTLEEYQQQQQHPFHPKITTPDQNLYPDMYAKQDNQVQKDKHQIWERLLQTREQIKIEREQQHHDQQNREIEQQCTFQPQISQNSKHMAARRDDPVQQRLFREGQEKIFNKEKLRNQYLQEVDQELKRSQDRQGGQLKGERHQQKPLHERVDKLVQDKQDRMQQIILEREQDQKMTFQPHIDPNSKRMFQNKAANLSNNVVDRLHQYNDQQKQKIQSLIEKNIEEQSKEYTFRPQINNYTTSQEPSAHSHSSFVHRQQAALDEQREKHRLKQLQAQQKECQPPKINTLSSIIVQCDQERARENQIDQTNRLSKKDQQKNSLVKKQLQEGYYSQYDFKPKINKISQTIGVSRNTQEQQQLEKQKKQQKKMELEQQAMQECHFKPKIIQNKKYQYIESKYKQEQISDNIQHEIVSKNIKMQKIKQQAEYQELEECTFQPKVNAQAVVTEGELVDYVRGADRVIQKRDKVRTMQENKARREQQLFRMQDNYDYQKHTVNTKVVPFNFALQLRDREEDDPGDDVEKRQILRRVIENIQD